MNRMPSSSAQDRQIAVWFQKIENGEIKLPRFQRPQAWDRNRVCSLLDTVTKNLPLGVTLLLNVDQEQFVSRFLVSAPETGSRVTEHLLDGQQRLTALWRSLHNNYDDSKYFLYIRKFDKYLDENKIDTEDESSVYCRTRWVNKNGINMPLWADIPSESFNRGLIPLELLRPGDIASEYEKWVNDAINPIKPQSGIENYEEKLFEWMSLKNEILTTIRDYRETISHFNLPYLALPSQTSKETALQVFINMNTNSKPLSQYDIIRAEIEGVKGVSLDDYQNKLNSLYPNVKYYFELPFLILATSALMQDKLPNQRGMWDMKKDLMVENWDKMSIGLSKMSIFMESQGVYDQNRLPTNAVLSVIAALYTYIPENLDARGSFEILLRKYLWSSFFTDRYENSAASNAYNDFMALKNIITGKLNDKGLKYTENDVPVLDRTKYPLASEEELMRVGWPKRENIRARGIMAVFTKLGAFDFADGSQLSRQVLLESKRHYHHVFPDALLKEAEVESFLALNCALITDKTNLNISNKDPYRYLMERYEWTSEDIVHSRLKSHLIPIQELKNGGYEGLDDEKRIEKIKLDFEIFITKRANYVVKAVNELAQGKEISANDIINSI
ncbi:DUF262 domain-containing protein [Flavobacterium cyclinae]|uniref:DUF262 domain-containing protein n=1 Tax=Flavobacterium cyclinae TaxID=2895947 RepID=UPI001E38E87A|nr:DUF262 domain-containing protein [Flavobacterium cyclinae]UGS19895.1 DUF262 domain-containing protein [Flavobacterium cyclinae]